MADTIYTKGIWLKPQPTQYGIIYKLSIKFEDFVEFASEHIKENGYVNIDFQEKKNSEELYGKINTWVKKS